MEPIAQQLENLPGTCNTPVKNDEEETRKVDSGMDDGSNSSQDLGDQSEDEEVVSLRPKKTVHRIFDDESEDSREAISRGQDTHRSQSKELKTAEEALDEILNASSSSDDSDGEKQTLAASLKKKKIVKRRVSDDSSDDDRETLLSVIKNNAKSTMSDIFDAEDDSNHDGAVEDSSQTDSQPAVSQIQENSTERDGGSGAAEEGTKKDGSKKKKKKRKKEMSPKKKTVESKFGTGTDFKSKEFISDSSDSDDGDRPAKPTVPGGSDDSSGSSSGSDSNESEKDRKSDGDEGFDESTIDPALLKKLKKGAAKQEKPQRKAKRIAEEEKLQIHSETQRMIRESRVSIPYHQPAPRSLNDFLDRAKKKRQEYKVLVGTRDFTKAKLMQDLFQRTKLPPPTLSEKDNDSDEDWNPEDDHMKKLKDRLDEKRKRDNESYVSKTVHDNEEETSGIIKTVSDSEKIVEVNMETSVNTANKVDGEELSADTAKDDGAVSDNESLPEITDKMTDHERLVPQEGVNEAVTDVDSAKNTVNSEALESNMEIDESVSYTENKIDNKEQPVSDTLEDQSNDLDCKTIENGSISVNRMEDKLDAKCDSDPKCHSKENTCEQNSAENETDENKDPNVSLIGADTLTEKLSQESEAKDLKLTSEKKRNKLAALASIDLSNIKPCLSGNADTFVCLEEEERVAVTPGVAKLMDRLCKHSTKIGKKHPKDVDISIIQKDKAGMDREELKLNTFTYHTEEEQENPLLKLDTPGAKLMALKEQLQVKMKEKREQARQQRQELYDLDNEEGGFDVEEEAEMSDRSDTDVEDEEDVVDEEAMGEEEEELGNEEDREANPFADEEAVDDDDVCGDDDDDEMKLKLDVSDEESEGEEMEPAVKASNKKKNTSLHISDDETGDTDGLSADKDEEIVHSPEFKEPAEKPSDKPFSMFGSKSTSKESIPDTQLQSGQRSFSLTFPEESQDLYGNNTIPELGPTQFGRTQESQKLNFFLEDSQSNMLDADGYLRVKSTAKKPTKPAGLDEMPESQDQMDDLLDLCSGRFTGIQQSKEKTSRKSLFDEPELQDTQGGMDELMGLCSGAFPKTLQQGSHTKVFNSKDLDDESEAQDTQGNMDELMGLCSGVFTKGSERETQKKGLKRKASEDDGEDSIEAFSDDEGHQDDKDDFIDDEADLEENDDTNQVSDEEEDGAEQNDEDDDDEKEKKATKFTGFTVKNKHGRIRREFVDAEAELSGSEVDSDEDLDLAEDEDIMEIEEGDKDAIANNDQLRDEVGRVHLKQLIDEDKRELMRFQEMYLPDGDLHSEGNGRIRRFRWNNADDDTQQDMFNSDSDGELVEDEADTDFKWRKERYEREQFIQEQQEKETEETEGSQFMKFGKIFLKKQNSVDKTVVSEKPSANNTTAPGKESPSAGFYKLTSQKRGSFLARSKESLAKIAEMTKPVANPSAGAKSSGKFTFAVISPDKENSQQTEKADKPKRVARTDVNKGKVTVGKTAPPAKKQKLDTEDSFTENSIFHHL